MKRHIMLVAVFLVAMTGVCRAQSTDTLTLDDVLSKASGVKSGVFYNIEDSKFQVINSFSVAEYKGFSLDIGYASQQVLCASLNYEVARLENFGIKLPVLKDVVAKVGATAGIKRLGGSNEFVYGPDAVLQVRF